MPVAGWCSTVVAACFTLFSTLLAVGQNHAVHREAFSKQPPFWLGLDTSNRQQPHMRFGPRGLTWRSTSNFTRMYTRVQSFDGQQPWSVQVHATIDSASPSLAVGLLCGTPERRITFYYRPADHSTGTRLNMVVANSWRALGTKHRDSIFRPSVAARPTTGPLVLSLSRKGASLLFQVNNATLDSLTGPDAQAFLDSPALTAGILIHGLGVASFSDLTASTVAPAFSVAPPTFRKVHRTFVRELNLDTFRMSDRAPKVAPNGASIYWVRSTRDSSDVVYTADRITDSTWIGTRPIGAPINNTSSNSVIGISQDNNQLMLWGRYKPDGAGDGPGLSTTTRTATGWAVPSNLTIAGYKNHSRNREESMSPDGSVIVLSYQADASRKDEKDLYVSRRIGPDSFSVPIRIPEPVSSSFNELSPTIAADGRTLYFSSHRPGFGDADVWVCKRLDDTWLKWSEPVNMGPGVNTPGWDAFFTIHPAGHYAYMRTSDGFNSGIYRLTLPTGAVNNTVLPDPTTVVSGRVLNGATNEPLGGAIKIVSLDGAMSSSAISEPAQGEYSIVLPSGRDYAFYAERGGFFPVSQHVRLTSSKTSTAVRQDLVLFPIAINSTIRLNNVFFETNKFDLHEESREELLRLVTMLTSRPSLHVEIGGHTDDRASASHNQALSERRAQAVLDFLIRNGIAPQRLVARGYGKSRPLTKSTTNEARLRNRRVEFTIVKE